MQWLQLFEYSLYFYDSYYWYYDFSKLRLTATYLILWPVVCILLIVSFVNIETILWTLYPQSIQAPNSLHCLNTRSRVVFWDSWPVTGDQPGPPGLVPWSQSQQCRPLHKVHSLLQLSPNRGRPEPACNHCLMPNCTFMTRHRLPHAYSASILPNYLNSQNTSQYHYRDERKPRWQFF